MPLELWKRRTQIGCCIEAVSDTQETAIALAWVLTPHIRHPRFVQFCNMLVLLTVTYYLPLYYQSAQRKSAAQSAIDILTFTVIAGYLTTCLLGASPYSFMLNRFCYVYRSLYPVVPW